jgi:uncharacterized protein (DUF433 family)
MARYPLNLPSELKREAEDWAASQGVSLNQFILWSVAEKVGSLRQNLDDPDFPAITYRRGVAGWPKPVIRGTGVRVQTVVVAARHWQMAGDEIAAEYELSQAQVDQALAFYEAHQVEIDSALTAEHALEEVRG